MAPQRSPGSTALTLTRLSPHCWHFIRRANLPSRKSYPTGLASTAGSITAECEQLAHLIQMW